MARSARSAGLGLVVRAGYAKKLRHLLSSFPSEGLRLQLEAVEAGQELALDSETLAVALMRMDHPGWRAFVHRSDPQNLRRFILSTDNRLVEIAPSPNTDEVHQNVNET
jgi:hypothetical protein